MQRGWVAACMAVACFMGCRSEPAMTRQLDKERLIGTIRQKLLESVEAEKSAVLATTDEESQTLAQEARNSAAAIDTLRGELRQRIVADGRRAEVEKLDAFDEAWAGLKRIDERLLARAVANTNLKATRLLSREGATALDRFVNGLTAMQRAVTDPETIRTLSRASVAALRSESVLFVHIPSADDAEMTRLEQQLRDLGAEVEGCLRAARESGQAGQEQLASTSQAWDEFQRLVPEIVRLSRQNSNVISFDVSVHEKRQAMQECLSALSALSVAVEAGPHDTR